MNYLVTTPVTHQDWQDYYHLRWQILREPWQQPEGSEKDQHEDDAYHCLVKDEYGKAVAIGRLHMLDSETAQIRYMAVPPHLLHHGLGSLVLSQLETVAKDNGVREIQLHARETALEFYEKCGYNCLQPSHTLYDCIRHFLMSKHIR